MADYLRKHGGVWRDSRICDLVLAWRVEDVDVDMNAADRAVAGAALAPLTNEQKTRLVLLAREAWEKSEKTNVQHSTLNFQRSRKRDANAFDVRCSVLDVPSSDSSSVPGSAIPAPSFDEWRHQQVMFAVERPGLTACRNEDYLPLSAHFLRLLGRTGAAEIAAARAWEDPRRQALAKLQHECRAAADVMPAAWNYAAGFVRNKRGVAIDDADARTIWHAVFLVRRRVGQLRGKTRRSERGNEEGGRE